MKRVYFLLAVLVVFLASVGISACGTITAGIVGMQKPYDEPLEGKRAKLRVIYTMFDQIYIYPSSTSRAEIKNDNAGGRAISKAVSRSGFNTVSGNVVTFEEKLIGMPFPPFLLEPNLSRVYSEFYIPAENDFLVRMHYFSNYGAPGSPVGYSSISCPFKHFNMRAKENGNYELELIRTREHCIYQMSEITEDGRRIPVQAWRSIEQ